MGMSRIIYKIIKIFQFIVIIILYILFYVVWNSALISNVDSWMECMTFHVQLLNNYKMGDHVAWGVNKGLSPG